MGNQPESFLLLSPAQSPLLHPFPSLPQDSAYDSGYDLATPQRWLQGPGAERRAVSFPSKGRTLEEEIETASTPPPTIFLRWEILCSWGWSQWSKPFPRPGVGWGLLRYCFSKNRYGKPS